MTTFHRDYLPPPKPEEKAEVPEELAVRIVRKAVAMADQLQERAIDQMVRDARRALERGASAELIIRQMEL